MADVGQINLLWRLGKAPIWCSKAKRSGTPNAQTSFPLLKRQISTTSIATGLPDAGSMPVALQRYPDASAFVRPSAARPLHRTGTSNVVGLR